MGDIGSDDLFGGPGDDYLSVKKQPVNMMNFNKLCGGDGADILLGAGNAEDLLDSEIPNGNDGNLDTLTGRTEGNTLYEYTPIHDQIIINDPPPLQQPGDNVPDPVDIDCP
jgi:Ca2+-binding RTX toxin-like protein